VIGPGEGVLYPGPQDRQRGGAGLPPDMRYPLATIVS